MISVLVADSERLFAESLRMALGYETGLEVHEEEPLTGLDAVQDIIRLRPDVAVLDYWMRGMEGLPPSGSFWPAIRNKKSS